MPLAPNDCTVSLGTPLQAGGTVENAGSPMI
jgi:hypothetical protein